jgi:hypothetical protein
MAARLPPRAIAAAQAYLREHELEFGDGWRTDKDRTLVDDAGRLGYLVRIAPQPDPTLRDAIGLQLLHDLGEWHVLGHAYLTDRLLNDWPEGGLPGPLITFELDPGLDSL